MLDDRRLNILVAGTIFLICLLLGVAVMALGGVVMYSGYEQERPGVLIGASMFILVGLSFVLGIGYTVVKRLRNGDFLPNYPDNRPLDKLSVGSVIGGALFIGGGLYLCYSTYSAGGGLMGYTFAVLAGLFGILTILGVTSPGGAGAGD